LYFLEKNICFYPCDNFNLFFQLQNILDEEFLISKNERKKYYTVKLVYVIWRGNYKNIELNNKVLINYPQVSATIKNDKRNNSLCLE